MQIIRNFWITCLFVSMASSCQLTGNEDTKPNEQPATGNIDKVKLLQLVNNLRQQGCTCGTTAMPAVAAIAWHDLLEKAAKGHSQDMYDKKYFSHTSQDGRTMSQRITNAGYVWTFCGENIAQGYANETAVIEGWKNSEGHCKNIMKAEFKEMGVGKVGDYWTQVFGTR
jgi:uncharacterized protein YkwD